MASEQQKEELIKFGKHLAGLRKKKNLSYRKLAQKCDIEYPQIKRYEMGEVNMSFVALLELSKGLGISLKELIDYQ
jgi:transcriptional regulator with XRE-family HTH domain